MDTTQLKKLQNTELEILMLVDDICKEHHIPYILFAGSALGAVRHRGFIPWDDDLDIAMSRNSYEKFIRIWDSLNNKDYTFQDYYREPRFQYSFGKIRKNNTFYAEESMLQEDMHNGIFLDIMPLDRAPNTKIRRFLQCIAGLFFLLFTRGYPSKKDGKLLYFATKILLTLIPKSVHATLRERCKRHIIKYKDSSGAFINYATVMGIKYKTYFAPDIFTKTVHVQFDYIKLPIPTAYDDYLKSLYGDYMKLPPKAERVPKHNGTLIFDLNNR